MRAVFATVFGLLIGLAAGVSQAQQQATLVAVPDALKASPGETVTMVVPARGVQIYECRSKRDAAGTYEWAFVAPEAELFDSKGSRIGKHYGGPTWEAIDGSKLTAVLKARADAPLAGSIPWLLLTATATGAKGVFSGVTSIQRVNTVGGVVPIVSCTQANSGQAARMPYTADYYFLSAR